ncbi:MAG: ribonuclease H-like domain-containing protein [Lachnospiraceae bacterium]|nr:ribonuclease H-like domain-containing protein [Lachnospiraceae bacterium]
MITRTVNLDNRSLFYDSCSSIIFGITGRISGDDAVPGPAPSDLLFFDIETTGLSAREACIYLIGCMYESDQGPVLTQLFSEDPSEEADVLSAFRDLVSEHNIAVHYNGSTFDIPFINARAAEYSIAMPDFGSQLDIYRELKPLKSLLGLKSLRMKAVEEYTGIRRRDLYDGGELIELYIKYISMNKLRKLKRSLHGHETADALGPDICDANTDLAASGKHKIVSSFSDYTGLRLIGQEDAGELLRILLLHNYEDVENMLGVSRLLKLTAFMNGAFKVVSVDISDSGSSVRIVLTPDSSLVSDFFGTRKKSFIAQPSGTSAVGVRCGSTDKFGTRPSGVTGDTTDETHDNAISVYFEIEAYDTELKLFFPDYKNYYYLVNEDYAIHKSIGQFVDKERCIKCTAANCYTRKQGIFLPVFEKKGGALSDRIHLYRRSAPDKSLFVLADDLVNNLDAAKIYVMQMLSALTY